MPLEQTTHTGLNLAFRSLERADVAPVMELERQVQSHPWRPSSYDDCLEGRHHCWLAEHEGQLVGFVVVAWAGGDGELLNIAVAPEWQRQGVGRCLLALARERVRPFSSMLFLEVRASNRQAIEFYERESFCEVGVRPNYYPAGKGREDALILAYQF